MTDSAKDARELFLKALSQTGNASAACQAAGQLTRRQVRTFREQDPDFKQAYDDAMEDAADLLEAEAWRRAVEGTTQQVLKNGIIVIDPITNQPITVRHYSDPLLVMLLRGCKPEKFQMRGVRSLPADPMIGIREIADDNDPPRASPKRR